MAITKYKPGVKYFFQPEEMKAEVMQQMPWYDVKSKDLEERFEGGWVYSPQTHLLTSLICPTLTLRPARRMTPLVPIKEEALVWDDGFAWIGTSKHGCVITTGWDPEIFVLDGAGKLLPAFSFLPPKSQPVLVPTASSFSSKTGNSCYFDGFQAEFTTVPYGCHGYGMDQVRAGLARIQKMARLRDSSAKLTLQNVFRIPKVSLRKYPADFVALGCNPSLNAYGTPPFDADNPFEVPYRVAGGHVHFGLQPEIIRQKKTVYPFLVKFFDLLCVLPTIGMFGNFDNPKRRAYYGRAGEFRETAYGLELRSLSNAWLGSPVAAHLVMNLARMAMNPWARDVGLELPVEDQEEVRRIIDATDVAGARKFFQQHRSFWTKAVQMIYFPGEPESPDMRKSQRMFETAVMKGIETVVPDFGNIEKAWKLNGTWNDHSDASRATWTYLVTHGKGEAIS